MYNLPVFRAAIEQYFLLYIGMLSPIMNTHRFTNATW